MFIDIFIGIQTLFAGCFEMLQQHCSSLLEKRRNAAYLVTFFHYGMHLIHFVVYNMLIEVDYTK